MVKTKTEKEQNCSLKPAHQNINKRVCIEKVSMSIKINWMGSIQRRFPIGHEPREQTKN